MTVDMVKVEIKPGVFVKVRAEDKDRFLATYPDAKVAEGDDKADDEPKAAEAPREAPEKTEEPRETEDKAVEAPNPAFRARRADR
jgi:hypothetical protein